MDQPRDNVIQGPFAGARDSDALTRNDDGTITVRLGTPLSIFKGKDRPAETIDTITLQRPKARHLAVTDQVKGDVAKSLRLIEALSGVSERALGELDAADLEIISEVLSELTKRRAG